MKIKVKEHQTFGIIGLPRSGTTLLANIFNSIDNSICLSEPIRGMHGNTIKNADFGVGMSEINAITKSTDSFLKGVNSFIRKSPENAIFGIKETYSQIPTRVNKEIRKLFNEVDFLIFIIREPKATYAGWRQLKMIPKFGPSLNRNAFEEFDADDYTYRPRYNLNAKHFVGTYNSLIRQYHKVKMNKPTFLIRYEDLCENFSADYMNDIFKGYIEFEGELDEIQNAIWTLGDHMAKDSKEIREPRKTFDNISKENAEYIHEMVYDEYKNLRGYGYY